MYYTGINPFTKEEVYIARNLRDRKMQRALMQFFKPENWFTVREALIEAGRQDLIGNGCDCLIPAQPPKEAVEALQTALADRTAPTVLYCRTGNRSARVVEFLQDSGFDKVWNLSGGIRAWSNEIDPSVGRF